MAYVINDSCISCGACAAECPVEAISEGESKFQINADACIDCGSCANVCISSVSPFKLLNSCLKRSKDE